MRIHSDTTSTTLTYLFWELAQHPQWQTRLRAELSTSGDWKDGLPTFNNLADLPVLEAVINEALRLHPAAPASLPRETPAGGRVLNTVYIPEKVSWLHKTSYFTYRDAACLTFGIVPHLDNRVHAVLHDTSRSPDLRKPRVFPARAMARTRCNV